MGMDAARITLHSCTLRDCKGPGVDLSGTAQASISGGRVEACVGGVWLWDNAHASLQRAKVAGGPSHAILADGGAVLEVRVSGVEVCVLGSCTLGTTDRAASAALSVLAAVPLPAHLPAYCLPASRYLSAPGLHCSWVCARNRARLGGHPAPLQPPGAARGAHRLSARGGPLPLHP